MEGIENQDTKKTAALITDWYEKSGRDLPWRHTKDPYAIWVSEIMLQQTQVDTVIPYFLRFIGRFPDIHSLACAKTEEVYKLWEGLGYYRRAANLRESAQMVDNKYGGIFPQDREEILSLKGIGRYTSSAIASIAFEQPFGVVDGNTLRIISRIYALDENIALEKTKDHYEKLMDELILYEQPSVFNQAMMDLGAMICTARSPKCGICPVKDYCMALQKGLQEVLPVNIKKVNKTVSSLITGVIRCGDRYFMIRNEQGLLENLYGFVQYECGTPAEYERLFRQQYGISVRLTRYIKDIKHVFTHKTWQMHIYCGEITEEHPDLYSPQQIEELPVSTAHLKVLKAYMKDLEAEYDNKRKAGSLGT